MTDQIHELFTQKMGKPDLKMIEANHSDVPTAKPVVNSTELIKAQLQTLIVENGVQEVLSALATEIMGIEGAGNGYYIAKILEQLANIEW